MDFRSDLTAISTLNLLPSTRQQVELFAQQIIDEVLEGTANPLNVQIQIVAFEKALAMIKDGIKAAALMEAEKYGVKQFNHHGCKIEIKELGTKYDFSTCQDFEWERLNTDLATTKTNMADREGFLKTLKSGIDMVDEQTGEIRRIYPPTKKSTTGIAITIK